MLIALKWVAIVFVLAIAGVLIYAATLPDDFRVSRSVAIKAPPEKIFPLIDDLKAFNTWNPFLKAEPDSKLEYSANTAGKGAAYTFAGNRSGSGKIEITASTSPTQVDMNLDMIKPIEGHNKIVFALQPKGEATEVSWTMSGARPYIGKVLSAVFSMDRMVGTPFAQGLADLKTLAEK